MSTYRVRLPDGKTAIVEGPGDLKLKRSMPDDEALAAVRRYVAKHTARALEPLIKPRGPWKEITRNEAGQIIGLQEHPADPPAAEIAADLGKQLAALYVSEIDGDA